MSHTLSSAPLHHGGNLIAASLDTGIAISDWLDLSTGISPYNYPSENIPLSAFTHLPYENTEFRKSVSTYYGCKNFVSLSGTQTAIQILPTLLAKLPVLLPTVGYQEHAQAWLHYGNKISHYDALSAPQAKHDIERSIQDQPDQHVVIINPNNPSSLKFSSKTLLRWAKLLGEDAYLIVDEAFIDSHLSQDPNDSLVPQLTDHVSSKIIVLRSFGKFFGLAGIRLGFIFANPELCQQVAALLPLWSVNGPAQHLAQQALTDNTWLSQHHLNLARSEQHCRELFSPIQARSECIACFHESLFSSYLFTKNTAKQLFDHFYQSGILLRLIDVSNERSIIRIGRIKTEDTDASARIKTVLDAL